VANGGPQPPERKATATPRRPHTGKEEPEHADPPSGTGRGSSKSTRAGRPWAAAPNFAGPSWDGYCVNGPAESLAGPPRANEDTPNRTPRPGTRAGEEQGAEGGGDPSKEPPAPPQNLPPRPGEESLIEGPRGKARRRGRAGTLTES